MPVSASEHTASAESASEAEASRSGPITTAIAAARSLTTFLFISVYTLVLAPVGLIVLRIFRTNELLFVFGHGAVWLALRLAGIRYRVAGREHVPATRAVVFCANHQSNVDPPVLFKALHRRLYFLYKAELSKLPILGYMFDAGGFVPIERSNREEAMASIRRGAASIRQGHSFLIFPEGTRSRTDALLPFKKGGFIMAIQAQAPILPVAISGGRAAMRRGSWMLWPARVTVRIGEPVDTAGLTADDRDRLIAIVRTRIEALLAAGPL